MRIELETGSFEIFCRLCSGPWLTALHGFPSGGNARVSHLLSHYIDDRRRNAARSEAALEHTHAPLHLGHGGPGISLIYQE